MKMDRIAKDKKMYENFSGSLWDFEQDRIRGR